MSSSTAPAEPLAIIGIGCLFPGAENYPAFWTRIVNRHDAIRSVPPSHWHAEDYLDPDPRSPDRVYSARGGFLEPVPFNTAAFGIPPSNLEATDASQLLGLVVAQQALDDCGYSIASKERPAPAENRTVDRSRVSVILGVTGTLQLVIPLGARLGHPLWRRALREAGVDEEVARDVIERIGDGYVGWQENSFPGLLGNVVAGRIANRFDLGGTNCVVDAACASSLSAIHLAAMELTTGRADVVLTGGVDTFNDIFMFTCFSKTPALSPTGNARPFDAQGDGTVLGEGLGMIVLKRLAEARQDGDRIYAVLRGIGSSSDGKGNAIYAPRKEGQIEALRNAYRHAGVDPASIELVEAHGTGTRVGDATELSALSEVYGQARPGAGPWCALGSIKSQIGHTKAAAGIAGLIKAAAALYHKVLPPTIKVEQPLPLLQTPDCPFYLNSEKRPWLPGATPRRAAVSAFGFGGSNFHAVLEEADPDKPGIDWTGEVQLVAFAADTIAGLRQAVENWPVDLPWPELCRRAIASRQIDLTRAPARLVLVVQRERTDLARQRQAALESLDRLATESVARPDQGVFAGLGPAAGQLAILFPGQGAQFVGMLRDLVCHFPPALDVLTRADAAFRTRGPSRLLDHIYPPPAFTPEGRAAQEKALQATEVAQPALGAVCLGAWRVLELFGVQGDAFAGHSYGEWTALCAAGWLEEADLHVLSRLRGEAMAQAGRSHQPGTMLALKASEAEIVPLLAQEGIDCVLANRNAPRQVVLSGTVAQIERAAAVLTARKITAVRLGVAAAFHSPLVASAREPMLRALESVPIQPNRPVYANSTAGRYPSDPAAVRELLASQLARPVEWVRQIEALYDAGVRSFLEVGPGARLTGLVEQILTGRSMSALSIDASAGQRGGFHDLACALAWLATRGHRIQLNQWDPLAPPAKPDAGKNPAIVELSGAQYRKPRPAHPPRPQTQTIQRNGSQELSRPAPVVSPQPVTVSGQGPSMMSASNPAPRPDPTALNRALEITRENLAALQRLQEQSAQLHRQFLDGQDQAQRSVQLLVEQQQRLLQASLGLPVAPLPAPTVLTSPPAVTPALPALPVPPAPPRETPVFQAPTEVRPVERPPTPTRPEAPAPLRPAEIPVPSPAVRETPPVAGKQLERVSHILLEVIAEKTGYPAESLELGMSLDADLGIDSIKRVEILSALQERLPEAPAVKPEHLGTLHTLADIASFLAEGSSQAAVSPAQTNGVHGSHLALEHARQVLLEVIAEKTGYPAESLELGMSLDADLGIDSIKRVEILSALQERLPEAPAVKPEHLGTLHTLADIASFLAAAPTPATANKPQPAAEPAPPVAPAPEPAPTVNASAVPLDRFAVVTVPLTSPRQPLALPAGGEIWINLDNPDLAQTLSKGLAARGFRPRLAPARELVSFTSEPAGLILLAPTAGANEAWLSSALQVVQVVGPGLRRQGGVLLTVSHLDGAFGLGRGQPIREPLDGALAGLAKTVAREWAGVHARAIDLAPDLATETMADRLIEELTHSGPLEVGISTGGLVTLECRLTPVAGGRHTPFQPGEVVVISGGARGVTAAVAVALARQFRPTLMLLGRTPEPGVEAPGLAELVEETSLRQELSRRHPELTPRAIGEKARQVLAAREIRATLEQIAASRATAIYRSVDLRDPSAAATVLAEIRRTHGPIRGLIHGAGVLADSRIEDKTPEQFAAVFQTKVNGLKGLLAAIPAEELRAVVLFSSSTARFGRTGQVDYAMANEALNKLAWQVAGQRPDCRVLSLNWGPWDGGMVTPSLRRLFASEGVGVIGLEAGAQLLIDELTAPVADAREVVVLAAGSAVPTGPAPTPSTGAHLPPALPVAFSRQLDVSDHPVLADHQLDGRPVLPVVLLLEWLAHAAIVQNPGLIFHGCDALRVLQGVILEGEPLQLRFGASKAVRKEGLFMASAEVRSQRGDGREILHARAEVVLSNSLPIAPPQSEEPDLPACLLTAQEAYEQKLLFHGPRLHAVEAIEACGESGIVGQVRCAAPAGQWLRQPLRQQWLADPLALDGVLQLLILWSQLQRGTGNLPCHLGKYRQYRRVYPADGIRVLARVTRASGLHLLADVDLLDSQGQKVASLEGVECVMDPNLSRAFRRSEVAAR